MEAASAPLPESWRKPSDDTLRACSTSTVIWLGNLGWLEMNDGPGAISPMIRMGWDAVKAAGEEG